MTARFLNVDFAAIAVRLADRGVLLEGMLTDLTFELSMAGIALTEAGDHEAAIRAEDAAVRGRTAINYRSLLEAEEE